MKEILPDEVRHISKLSRLSLTDEEVKKYAEQLSVVFTYVDMLGEVDTPSVQETCQVTGLEDVFRDDEAVDCPSDRKSKILDAFPEKLGKLLKVKKVFDS